MSLLSSFSRIYIFTTNVILAGDDYYEDDEEDDPDALKDPIYQIDLQVYAYFFVHL